MFVKGREKSWRRGEGGGGEVNINWFPESEPCS